jgi:hypothetical protein
MLIFGKAYIKASLSVIIKHVSSLALSKTILFLCNMSSRPDTWPDATGELLPTTLSKIADQYPDLVYAEYFTDAIDIAKGYYKVTYRDFANAVHATAWWIEKHVGKPKVQDGSETMVYFGPNDLRYGMLVLASIMVGYKVRLHDLLSCRILTQHTRCYSHQLVTAPNPSPN